MGGVHEAARVHRIDWQLGGRVAACCESPESRAASADHRAGARRHPVGWQIAGSIQIALTIFDMISIKTLYRAVCERAIFHETEEPSQLLSFFGDDPGIFVDIGANDPRIGSVSWPLEQVGWTGILVEPLADEAKKLREARRATVFEVACGPPEQDGMDVDFLVAGIFSTLKNRLMVPRSTIPPVVGTVRVRTLDSILAEAQISSIDLLSIDVEGAEIDVLRGFSLERFKPRLILIEDHVRDWSKHRYLQSRGYKLIRRTGLNAWYVPRGHISPISLRGRLELLRKYVLALPFRLIKYHWQFRRYPNSSD
jgi:FkbM family methyltransferase